eukprot:scaffold42639_cov15-Prasinocladus_malaysianus.AAC.1
MQAEEKAEEAKRQEAERARRAEEKRQKAEAAQLDQYALIHELTAILAVKRGTESILHTAPALQFAKCLEMLWHILPLSTECKGGDLGA